MTLIVFESLRPDDSESRSFWISDPELILQCRQLLEVPALLETLERKVNEGYTAAGFLCYDAGYAFLPHLPEPRPPSLPLAWFALSKKVNDGIPEAFRNEAGPLLRASARPRPPAAISDLKLNQDQDSYTNAIQQIKHRIARGDTYQVNYTIRFTGDYDGEPAALYKHLRRQQRVNYSALIETPDWAIVSLSPELFFRKRGRTLTMRPMKGTAQRGRNLQEDQMRARELSANAKERSENLMIVDLLRNDLGKICEPGSIEVTAPMNVETYETLLQMTTTINGKLLPDKGLTDIFKSTFPSGSITGAPKISTMNIIHELESGPRGIYTGAIGFCTPEESVFSVAIRTVQIDRPNKRLEMGTGSGILFEADPVREYQECLLKGRFLTEPADEFNLFETILWIPQKGYERLSQHMQRMSESAQYFLFRFDQAQMLRELEKLEMKLNTTKTSHRVRVEAFSNGAIRIESNAMETPDFRMSRSGHVLTAISSIHTDSADRFLFHKTTKRQIYDTELANARQRGLFDILFQNEKNQITEGAISNIFILKGGVLFTPPVEAGLLPGTFRRHLLESGEFPVKERDLTVSDLRSADALYLTNALRGMVQVELEDQASLSLAPRI